MAAVVYIFALFLFLPLSKQENVDVYLPSVLQSLEKMIDFYSSEFQDVNVDGLFGLRVLEGHLGSIVEGYETGRLKHLEKEVVDRIRKMKDKAKDISSNAIREVKKHGPEYFKKMGFIVSSAWDVFDPVPHKINMTLKWSQEKYKIAKATVVLDETKSDRCMSELIGSHKSHGSACDISLGCVLLMTAQGLVGYGITHQVLWTMLAEKAGCRSKLESTLKASGLQGLDAVRHDLCSNNFIQLQETLRKLPDSGILPSLQDLFMEQLFVCPSLGYYQFLDLGYIPQIISWQYENGCYGKMKKPHVNMKTDAAWQQLMGSFVDDYIDDDNENKGLSLDGIRDFIKQKGGDALAYIKDNDSRVKGGNHKHGEWEMGANKGRKLLVEHVMAGNCLAHKTAVASGALVMYLRYLCHPDADVLFSQHRSSHAVPRSVNQNVSSPTASSKPVLNPPRNVDNRSKKTLYGNNNNQIDLTKNKGKVNGSKLIGVKSSVRTKDLNLAVNQNNVVLGRQEKVILGKGSDFGKFGDVPLRIAGNDRSLDNNYNLKNGDRYENVKINGVDNDNRDLDTKIDHTVKEVNGFRRRIHDDEKNYMPDEYGNNNDDNADDGGDDDNDEDDGDDDDEYDNDEYNAVNEDDTLANYPVQRDDTGDYRPAENYGDDPHNEDGHLDNNPKVIHYDNVNVKTIHRGNDNNAQMAHPHIHSRNIGNSKNQDYDGNLDDGGQVHKMKDYDDDEEEDDYAYDDDQDEEMERRRQEELRDGFILAKSGGKTTGAPDRSVLAPPAAISYTTVFMMSCLCVVLVFVLYRCLRRRRMRIRVGHKYFHV